MRRIAHALIALIGTPLWIVAYLCMQMVFRLAVLGDKVLPDARVGNCWTFVCAKVVRDGGYVLTRPVDESKFFGVGLVPHASWLESVPPGAVLLQTEPINRYKGILKIWRYFYFSFRLRTTESTRPRPWGDI